jgi:hypothetical protein
VVLPIRTVKHEVEYRRKERVIVIPCTGT